MTQQEFSRRGGRSKSAAKTTAALKNLAKAKAAKDDRRNGLKVKK